MYRLFATFLTLFSITYSIHAQNRTHVSASVEMGLPSGNFANLSNIGLGASLKVDLPIAERFALTVNGGFMNFFGRQNQIIHVADLTYLPLKGGLKYFFSAGFYLEGQLGAALPLNDGQKALLAWSPGIGNFFKLKNNSGLDFGIRYEAWTGKNNQQFATFNVNNTKGFGALHLGYVFGRY